MFRTVYVTKGEIIRTRDNWLIVQSGTSEKKVPLADIETLVLDNPTAMISLYTLATMADIGVNVLICDNKHLPSCNVLSFTQHYRPYSVLKRQLALTKEFKGLLWKK